MKKTFIVLFDVGHTFDARPLAESIEGENFEVVNQSNCETVSALKVRDQIIKRLELDEEDHEHVGVYPLTDFMDEFNDQHIDDDSYFMGYVTGTLVEKPKPVDVNDETRWMHDYILIHVARTWERVRMTQPHQEMPQDNIESAEDSIPSITYTIFNNDIIQGFLTASEEVKSDNYWGKNTGTMSDWYIEQVAEDIIKKDYLD